METDRAATRPSGAATQRAVQRRIAIEKFEEVQAEGVIDAAVLIPARGTYQSHCISESELMMTFAERLKGVVDVTGFEPATPWLQTRCSPS